MTFDLFGQPAVTTRNPRVSVDSEARMKYSVTITDTTTGESRTIPQGSLDWEGDTDLFWWTEGNYGCDCNRGRLYWGREKEDDFHPCGDSRYRLDRIDLEDGTEFAKYLNPSVRSEQAPDLSHDRPEITPPSAEAEPNAA